MLDELGLYREQAGRILEHPHKVQGDSKQSISQWRARERRVISQVWGLERIRMGGGEENSVKLLRVRMSGRQGLGPTSRSCRGWMLSGLSGNYGTGGPKKRKGQAQVQQQQHWTGLLLLPSPLAAAAMLPSHQPINCLLPLFLVRPSVRR